MGSCRTHEKKYSQKIALLPISSIFGTQEAKRFSQTLNKFEQRHLNFESIKFLFFSLFVSVFFLDLFSRRYELP